MWQLVINGPGYFDTNYDLPEGVTQLGRADENDIVLSGDLVSRKHARLHVRGNTLSLEDLGGRNGSRINNKAVIGTTAPVSSGDLLAVGENTLQVRQPTTAEKANTELVDAGAGGVRRFGGGTDLGPSMVLARGFRESAVQRVLGNTGSLEGRTAPKKPSDTDELESHETHTSDNSIASDSPVAWQSLVLLYKVAEKLSEAQNLQSFLDETTDLVMTHVGATTGVVLIRHSTGVLVPSAVRHAGKLQKGEVPVSDAIIDAAVSQGQAIAVADVQDDARFAARESVVLYGADQVLCIPIGRADPFDGVLYLNRPQGKKKDPGPVDALLDTCTAIAQLLSTGVQKFQPKAATDDRLQLTLQRFHGPEVVDRRLAELQTGTSKLASLETKNVTVLFADIAGFTAFSHATAPERVVDVLGGFYKLATQLVFSFEGTLDKFVGDSVMAIFGAPYAKGDDTIRAVRTALALRAEWKRAMSRRPPAERLELRIGLNTGKALVGALGTESRLDFTAVGESVNIASWLCATANPGQVLITGKTLAGIGARFDVNPLGERPLSGSKVRTAAFEVLEEDADSGTLSGVR